MGYEKRYDFCAMTGKSHVEKVPLRRQQNKLKASKMNEAKILFRLYMYGLPPYFKTKEPLR